jgi:hypothetical protein
MKRPLSLTDNQLRLIERAARALPVNTRDAFLQDVCRARCQPPTASNGLFDATRLSRSIVRLNLKAQTYLKEMC